jgi:phosphoglycolate phosphatase
LKNKKVLIFDYDGVIVDSLDLTLEVIGPFAQKYHLPEVKTRKDIGKFFETNFFDTLKRFGLTKVHAQEFLEALKKQHKKKESELQVFSGMHNVLIELASKNTLVIISSNHKYAIENYLKKQKLDTIVSFIAGAETKGSKTDKIIDVIIKFTTPKEDVYYIGDTIGDVLEGKKAGVKTVAVSWGWHDKEKLITASPDYLLDEVKQLKDIFMYVR